MPAPTRGRAAAAGRASARNRPRAGRRCPVAMCVLMAVLMDGRLGLARDADSVWPLPGAEAFAPGEGAWHWLGGGQTGEDADRALARDDAGERFALGGPGGVSIFGGGRRSRLASPSVRDLAFDSAGELWVATEAGLFRSSDSGGLERRSLRGGERANRIDRIERAGRGLLVATEGGAFFSASGQVFQALELGGAAQSVALIAGGLGPSGEGTAGVPRLRVWALVGNQLHALTGLVAPAGLRVLRRERFDLPRPMSEDRPVDLFFESASGRLMLVYRDVVAWRNGGLAAAKDGESRGWTMMRPVMPPGASIRRLAQVAGQLWLATDHGLLVGGFLSGGFRRAEQPVGTTPCSDLVAAPARNTREGLVVLCRRGLYAWRTPAVHSKGRDAAAEERAPRRIARPIATEPLPPVAAIRERALDLAGLSTSRSVALRRGLSRRAYWPDLSLRLDADFDRDTQFDSDQAFVSGDTRQLYDRSRDRRTGYGATIELEWSLGGLVYPEDSVDLSRELRQVVSLRDDISDEINQLYTARIAAADQLQSGEALSPAARRALERRVQELDAGLDAWTAGWLLEWRLNQARLGPARAANETQARGVR